jgi:hypothetical protein
MIPRAMRGLVALALTTLGVAVLAAPTSATRVPPPSVPLPAQTLNQKHATLQFTGHWSSKWSLGPKITVDSCQTDTLHGTGTQKIDYSTTHGGHANRANVTIVDSGANLFFQVPPAHRAKPGQPAPGFRPGEIDQQGAVEDDFTNSPNRDPFGCPPLPDPPEQLQDESGCGTEHVPWDVQVLAVGSKFNVQVAADPQNGFVAHCPFYAATEVGSGGGDGSFTDMFETIPLSHVRKAMEKRHGKLIVHGTQRWHTDKPVGGADLSATTTVTWKLTLIRAAD